MFYILHYKLLLYHDTSRADHISCLKIKFKKPTLITFSERYLPLSENGKHNAISFIMLPLKLILTRHDKTFLIINSFHQLKLVLTEKYQSKIERVKEEKE